MFPRFLICDLKAQLRINFLKSGIWHCFVLIWVKGLQPPMGISIVFREFNPIRVCAGAIFYNRPECREHPFRPLWYKKWSWL